jgi:hypothetical protein
VEALISMVGLPPEGFEVLAYCFKCSLVMLFAGLAIYLISYLMRSMIDMGR